MEFRRLHPEPETVELEALMSSLKLADRAHGERPYTIVNFVASVDGRATINGRSGALGDDGDHAMFHSLREHVDAILVGTGTLQVERYGRLVKDPDRRQRRVETGLSPEPLACVVTRSGMVPTDIPLFSDPESRIVIFCDVPVDAGQLAARVDWVRVDPGELTLTTAMRHLRSDYGVRSVLCEGGPTIFSGLLHERLVDELFLTVAPKLAGGGTGPTITTGHELAEPAGLSLVWVLERAGSLYLRWGL
jgi:5-amino-6-(5-phosphoribosylamino)uracil reductase